MNQDTTGDSVVDEVYAIRAQIAEESNYDLRRIDEHARAAAIKMPGLKYVTLEEMRERKRSRRAAPSPKVPR